MKNIIKKIFKSLLTLLLITTVTVSSTAQKSVPTIEYVRTAKFGKEIVYYGQDDKVLNGTFKIAERSGAYSEATFIDGKPDGKWEGYDSSGRLEFYSTFAEGIGNGKGETYSQDGSVLNTYAYKNGEPDGEWIYRNEHGVYQIENYNEGLKEGKWVQTSRNYNGAVTSTTIEYYKNNDPTGTWEKTKGDNQKISVKVYSGPKSYSLTEYFENGFKKNEEIYENGVRVMEKKYHDNGKLALSATYNDKGPIGALDKFNEKGMIIRHTPYVDGHLQGVDVTYNYRSGNKYVEREYKNGITDGIYKEYYPSGKLALDGQYIKDQREGTWKYYKESGELKQERVFKNDNQVSDKRYD
ncbi:toxin-antitoxin system YwqK family antitoxin [Zobellia alginiliquefaciens]|uniref:toxin-antitoxin system YwqK family antitoxin n=1 Tax=Zobellia alginiliquefaciens TaxID=3032586 RepID=UPI0023E42507|nr:hypothetical protein [Zobellia alginiliquefaciens]